MGVDRRPRPILPIAIRSRGRESEFHPLAPELNVSAIAAKGSPRQREPRPPDCRSTVRGPEAQTLCGSSDAVRENTALRGA